MTSVESVLSSAYFFESVLRYLRPVWTSLLAVLCLEGVWRPSGALEVEFEPKTNPQARFEGGRDDGGNKA